MQVSAAIPQSKATTSVSSQTGINSLALCFKESSSALEPKSPLLNLDESTFIDDEITDEEHSSDGPEPHANKALLMTPPRSSKKRPHRMVDSEAVYHTVYHASGPFPPTPDSTPTKPIKRSKLLSHPIPSSTPSERHLKASPPTKRTIHHASIQKVSALRRPLPVINPRVSANDLKRISEAVLQLLNWSDVQDHVASNRAQSVYRKIIKDVLQARVNELVELELEEEASS